MIEYDTIVVGSGVAGLSFALRAAERGRVVLVTKGAVFESNTRYAQGGIACVTSIEDSFNLHIQDTLDAGAELCDPEAVRAIVTGGPDRIRELMDLGVRFDERSLPNGNRELDLGREGGHSKRRVLHAHDSTGSEIEGRLVERVRANPNIQVLENTMAVDLITSAKLGYSTENRCLGIYALAQSTGEVLAIRAEHTILATGGCGKIYLYSTNPDIATGDGVAMAWRAGVPISNMEFIQFHPTCLYHPREKSFLISEAVRGEGGILIDQAGNSFMERYHPQKSLAPRDVVARAIDAEMKRTGGKCVFVDITSRPADFIRERFPMIYERCLTLGIDITTDPIPVVPAAHYQCGGIQTTIDGATALPGLYAIGEVACTGLHGANRLASNSLLEALVVSYRANRQIANSQLRPTRPLSRFPLPEWVSGDAQDVDEMVVIYHNWDEIRRLMWDYVGIVRTDKRLHRAATRLRNLDRETQDFYWNFRITRDLLELRNLVTVAMLVVDSALSRKESRGLHYTLNHPEHDDRHFRHPTVLQKE